MSKSFTKKEMQTDNKCMKYFTLLVINKCKLKQPWERVIVPLSFSPAVCVRACLTVLLAGINGNWHKLLENNCAVCNYEPENSRTFWASNDSLSNIANKMVRYANKDSCTKCFIEAFILLKKMETPNIFKNMELVK